MKAIGRGGGEGWDKEEGKGKGEGSTPPVFSNTPQFELSRNKPAWDSLGKGNRNLNYRRKWE
jgi:hypothetical protein